jgi:hypothetical protein
MTDFYPDAPRSLRLSRLISKNREMLREIPPGGIESFERSLENHLSGLKIRSEVQAGAVRLYLLWREVESLLNRSGSFHEFSAVVRESTTKVFNFLRGAGGRSRYTSDQLHGWCCLLTRHWVSDGYQVHVILHPGGQIEPIVSPIEVGSLDNGGSK